MGEHNRAVMRRVLSVLVVLAVGVSCSSPGSSAAPVTQSLGWTIPPSPTGQLGPTPLPGASISPLDLPAGLQVDQQLDRYRIDGDTEAELLAAMLDHVRHDDQPDLWFAFTAWDIAYSYRYGPIDGGCAVQSVDVSVQLVVTAPQWDPPASAASALVDSWRAYESRALLHERGHEQISVDGAMELRQQLMDFSTPTSCTEFEAAANHLADRVIADIRAAHVRYDERTGHGRSQGAWWPPP